MRSISAREERSRQAVSGNAEAHHAAWLGGGLEDRDVVTEQRQIMRRGEAGRTGANHRDAAARTAGRRRGGAVKRQRQVAGVAVAFAAVAREQAILRIGPHRLHAVLLGDVALERANRDRRVDRRGGGRRPRTGRRRHARRPRRAGWARGRPERRLRDGRRQSTGHSGRRRSRRDSPPDISPAPSNERGRATARGSPFAFSLCSMRGARYRGYDRCHTPFRHRQRHDVRGKAKDIPREWWPECARLSVRCGESIDRSRGKLRCRRKTPAPMIGVIRRRVSHR